MTDLSREDAERLFNNVSKAVKDNDLEKLDTLYREPTPDDTELEDDTAPDVDDDTPDDSQPDLDDQPDDEEGKETSPPDEADEELPDEEDKGTGVDKELAELKAQLESMKKENHALKSQAGRVPHVQKRLRELDKKLEELKSASPSSQTSTKIKPKLDELLSDLKETDSVLAETIARAIEQATNGVDEELRAREIENLSFMREREAREYQAQEASRLLEMYPNAKEVFTSPHWAEWKEKQSEGVLALATSSNADDVARAFKLYADDMVAQYPDLAKSTADTAKKTDDPEAAAKAKKIEEERARKKQTAANIHSPSAQGKTALPDDPEALFKKFSEQIRKERTGQ